MGVGGSYVHLKGLSGFLRLPGGRPTGGLDITSTVDLEITVPGRRELSGLRVVIGLKRDANPQVVLNNLYKYSQLQQSFPVNTLALVRGRPARFRSRSTACALQRAFVRANS